MYKLFKKKSFFFNLDIKDITKEKRTALSIAEKEIILKVIIIGKKKKYKFCTTNNQYNTSKKNTNKKTFIFIKDLIKIIKKINMLKNYTFIKFFLKEN